MVTSVFEASAEPIPDPIFKLTELFQKDQNPKKVNLGVGIFKDEKGDAPFFQCIIRAKEKVLERLKAGEEKAEYLNLAGLPAYCAAIPPLLAGNTNYDKSHTWSIQTLGGSGALSVATKTFTFFTDTKKIYISNPTWPSHKTISLISGAEPCDYKYLNSSKDAIDLDAFCSSLKALPEKSVVILHASSHNPSGIDPTKEQWKEIAEVIVSRKIFPIVDSAYQGLGDSMDDDVWIVRHLVSLGVECFVATSFSKNMGLYNHRVGALTYFGVDSKNAAKMHENIKSRPIRGSYSNPPISGADCVAAILSNPEEKIRWLDELKSVRDRIVLMRKNFATGMKAHGYNFDFIEKQKGMFSYTGLMLPEVEVLRSSFGIYMSDDGRMNVAGLNGGNIDYVCNSIAAVLSKNAKAKKEVA